MWGCEDVKMWGREDVKMSRCDDVRMWRWADVKMWRCEDEKMWRCEDEKMWRWEDVKMRRREDEKMWSEKMWRWEDVKMRRCEGVKMRYRLWLLEEPCAQTLSGIKQSLITSHYVSFFIVSHYLSFRISQCLWVWASIYAAFAVGACTDIFWVGAQARRPPWFKFSGEETTNKPNRTE